MVQLGKPQAMWERTETLDDGSERKTQYALRKDGSLIRSASTLSPPDAEGKGTVTTDDWAVVSETDASPDIEELNKRMGASGFNLIEGDVPEPEP